ncbi:ImmA/IrrE family metallo-endopeptidase, partial [Leptolyngbya cf. ectocarpi LEGE 11479]
SWWKSEFENDKNAIPKLLDYLTKRLCLKVDFLQGASDLSLDFLPVSTKFKLQRNQENPSLFSNLARSVAKVVSQPMERSYEPIESSALAIRQSILQNHSCVSLNSLLTFCWEAGIPVVHFDKRPNGHVKSDGLVVMIDGRPVIVIGSSRQQSAWLLFILAHELGHIANGDLQDGILVDDAFVGGVIDKEEENANQFARQLLFGDSKLSWDSKLSRNGLLDEARQLSRTHCLDASSVVLNYAWQTGDWKCAMIALKILEPNANAPAQINTYCQRNWVSIDDESREYLERINILAD